MKLNKAEWTILGIVLCSFVIGFLLYPRLPEMVASHWNARGQVDGYMPRAWGVFILPIILLLVTILLTAVPRIDPLKSNIESFRKYYNIFMVILALFLLVVYLFTILWNLGIRTPIFIFLPVLFGVLFYYIGVLIGKSKRNWYIGIRTPWTLSSDAVWEKTHRIGGRLFKIAGIVCLFALLFPRYALFFILVPSIIFSMYAIVYSYYQFQKEKK